MTEWEYVMLDISWAFSYVALYNGSGYYLLELYRVFILQLVLPEYILHIFTNVLFLIAFEWITVLFNAPLILYHANRYLNRPVMSCPGLYDPTTIMNADELSRAQKEGWIKMAFYIVSFFYYLYSMIYVLVSS